MKKLFSKLKLLHSISFSQFIYFNFISKNVIRDKGSYLFPYKNSVINIDKTAKLILHGTIYINSNKPKKSKAEAYLTLQKNSILTVHKGLYLNYNATIEVHKDGEMEVGIAYVNSNAVLICARKIVLGEEVLVSREVFIYDSDHHDILNKFGEKTNIPKEIIIGNHVWIGIKSTIMKGTKLEDGAVIASNSVVISNIKAGQLASGNPARVFMEITWKN